MMPTFVIRTVTSAVYEKAIEAPSRFVALEQIHAEAVWDETTGWTRISKQSHVLEAGPSIEGQS